MASSYEIKNGKLIFRDNGEWKINEDEMKHISGDFTEIVFPPCLEKIYEIDFKYCKKQLANVTTLDFTKATNLYMMDSDSFKGAKSIKAVALPKNIRWSCCFKDCPKLKEIHIYNLNRADYGITCDADKRLTIYASNVDDKLSSLDDDFLADVGTLYVPLKDLKRLQKLRDKYNDELVILPLPEDYTFPTEALSEPWKPSETTSSSEEGTMLCPNCGERHSIDIDACPNCGFSASSSYEVVLVSTGRAKLQLIKAIKEACNYGLKEAKDIVDSALPASVIRGISKERADEIKQAIEDAGGKAKINGGEKTATKKANSSTASVLTTSTAVPATPTSSAPKAITLEDIYGGPQYYCVLVGQSFGPVTIRQFANMVRFGIVDKNTMVWKNGMSNWAIAQTVADLQSVV